MIYVRTVWNLMGAVLSAAIFLAVGCSEPGSEDRPTPPLARVRLAPAQSGELAGRPLFERISSGRTGIDFVHHWSPRDEYEANLLRTGFTGGGVCVGDYDSDGRCDVYFTRPHGGGQLYRNTGDLKFENVSERSGIHDPTTWSTGAVFVDVNNDGLLDLFVCAYRSANRLYLNLGNGRFREAAAAAGIAFAGASVKMVFADYDLDGDLDAFLVTNRLEPTDPPKIRYLGSEGNYSVAEEHRELVGVINLPSGEQKFTKAGQYDYLYRNELKETGELKFTEVGKSAGIVGTDHGLDAIWWDYNSDGFPDLYVANDFTDPDRLYENAGDGSFREVSRAVLPHTPWFTMGCAAGDFNDDGRFDLMATDMSGTSHFRQKVAMGSMESAAWFLDTAEPRQYMRNALFINTGTSRFLEAAHLAGVANSDWTWSVKAADLDCDGRQDLFVSNGFTRDYLDSDFNMTLREQGLEGTPSAWFTAPVLEERNIAFQNVGDLRFLDQAKAWGLDFRSVSFGAAVGDLDGDGDPDLVVNNFDTAPDVFLNRSTNRECLKLRLRGSRGNSHGIGAVVSVESEGRIQTRRLDPGNGYMSADEPVILFGFGERRRVSRLTVSWPGGREQTFDDLETGFFYTVTEPSGDADLREKKLPARLFERSGTISFRHVEAPYDDFERQPLLPNRLSNLGPGMAWGDVDGDGDDELFVGGAAGSAGALLMRSGEGKWDRVPMPALEIDAAAEDMGCLFFDADSDGDNDLYVVSGGVECSVGDSVLRDRLYLNQGVAAGTVVFVRADGMIPDLRDSGGPVAAADFDRDGDLDLVVGGRLVPGAYPVSPSSRLLRNEGGRFADVTETRGPGLLKAGMVTAVLWSDVDADGWLDLLLTVDYGPIRVFRNQAGQLEEVSEAAGTKELLGWWSGITGGDVDGDGDTDYAVANQGLNSKYHPSTSKPQLLFYGDFDGGGVKRLIEAKPGESGLLPVRGKSCSTAAMPFLAEKFQTFHAFAGATLSELYTEQRLNAALRLEVNTAESGVLINDGAGRFTFRSLPRLAQVAPVFGLQFFHADGDGVLDLVLAQNSFAPQRETGRMDGGVSLLMRGVGDGSFEAIWPGESGVVISGDAKALALADVNGDGLRDLIVTVNDGDLETFVRVAQPEFQLFGVSLQSGKGNGRAVGARVRLTCESGRTQVAEVYAGDGYLTQGSARLLFGLGKDDAPKDLEVRWPAGRVTRTGVNSREFSLVVAEP